jgi:hypothetical protein
MKAKFKLLSGSLPPTSSQNFRAEENISSVAIYTTAHARTLSKTAVEESRLKLSLLFSCCFTKRIQPVLPIQLGEPASWVFGSTEKGLYTAATAAVTPIVYFTVLS